MDESGEAQNVVISGLLRKPLGRSRVILHLKRILNDGLN